MNVALSLNLRAWEGFPDGSPTEDLEATVCHEDKDKTSAVCLRQWTATALHAQNRDEVPFSLLFRK
jgi:hypothetical protein